MKANRGVGSAVSVVSLCGREVQFILKRSSRRSIGISIDKKGNISVAAPFNVPEKNVKELLAKKSSWILSKLNFIEKSAAEEGDIPKTFRDGDKLLFMGEEYTLRLIQDKLLKLPIIRQGGDKALELYSANGCSIDQLRDTIRNWYVKEFEKIIKDCVDAYSKLLGVKPRRLTIREQKTRWGSCSSKGNLNFNWRLVMAPIDIFSYVAIHELCHMKEMNHSERFWALVGKLCPDYRLKRKWLKENGQKLTLD